MAQGDGQNFLSVLTGALGKGIEGVQAGLQEKRNNDLQNLMTGLQVQRADREQEAFMQNQELHQKKIQKIDLDLGILLQKSMDLTKSKEQIATEQAQAEVAAQQVKDQGRLASFTEQFNPMAISGPQAPDFALAQAKENFAAQVPEDQHISGFDALGLPTGFEPFRKSIANETKDARMYRLLGPEGYLAWTTGAQLQPKDLQKSFISWQKNDQELATPLGWTFTQWKENLGPDFFNSPDAIPTGGPQELSFEEVEELKRLEALEAQGK